MALLCFRRGAGTVDQQQIPRFARNDKKSPPLHALLYLAAGSLQEVGGAYDSEGDSDYEREVAAGGIVDYRRVGEMIFGATGYYFGAAGGEDVLDPLAVGAVG